MIRHIVVFKLEGESADVRAGRVATLKSTLEPLVALPGVRSLRVDADTTGIDSHWDAVLLSEHDDWDALAAYQTHSDHKKALDVVAAIASAKAVADYVV
ncbi:Dabb family protein [Microbacterium sp. RD1]|uniref:Dabb family protein n=1 Tax=Microbacterium sp. RD1 TaxID=3457313 RepID=UPI003FA5D80C